MYIMVDGLANGSLISKECNVLLNIGFAKITLIKIFKPNVFKHCFKWLN